MTLFYKLLFLILIFFAPLYLPFSKAHAEVIEPKFEHYTSRDGLSQNYVTSIFQDNKGLIWIGSFKGLNRFDGYSFKKYFSKESDESSLSQNSVHAIFQDKKGNLWFGTEYGLNKYNPKYESFKRYYHHNANGDISNQNNIRTIYEDEKGLFWIGFYGGGLKLFYPETGVFEEIIASHNQQLNSYKINTFFADSKGVFWIGTEQEGLLTFNPKTKELKQFLPNSNSDNSVSSNIISSLAEDRNGNMWIGTWGDGLNKFDRRTGRFSYYKANLQSSNSLTSNIVTSLTVDKNGLLWIGTFDNGLVSLNTTSDTFFQCTNNPSDINSLSHNVVWCIYQDRSGSYWVGTFGGGLNKYNPEAYHFESYQVDKSKRNWLNSNLLYSFLQTSAGDIYLGTYGGGINKFDRTNKSFSYILNNSTSQDRIIRAMYQDSEKNIWVSTDKGLYQYDERFNEKLFFEYRSSESSIGEKSVYSILEDSNHDMWFGLWNGGVKILKYSDLKSQSAATMRFKDFPFNRFSNSTVWALTKDSDNNIWIGANENMVCYNFASNSFDYFEEQRKAIDPNLIISANCFYEDVEMGKMWFGTLSDGIGYYDKNTKKIVLFSEKDGLAHNEVFSIFPDKNLNLWIGTSYGLSQFNLRTNTFRNFDINRDGSQNEILSKSWVLSTKEILVGGNRGFYIFDPETIRDNINPSPLILTDFKILNKSVNTYGQKSPLKEAINEVSEIEISQADNIFSIAFSILDYRNPFKNEFQYILEGFDTEWKSTIWSNREATYSNLESGTYLFRLKGCNSDGIWTREDRVLKITITPRFYSSWWFRLLMVLSVFIAVSAFVRQKFNKLKEQIKAKNADENVQKLIDDRELLRITNEELELDLFDKNKEMAAINLYLQKKDENLHKLRTELNTIVEQVKNSNKPQMLAIIKEIDQELKQRNGWDAFKDNIDMLQNDLIKRLADEFPKLTQKDLIVCAHIRMAKSNKDIAMLLNISLQSVEMARYRIRKKMDLDPKIILNDFLARY